MKKDDWIALAKFYKVEYRAGATKAEIKKNVLHYLVSAELLSLSVLDVCEEGTSEVVKLKIQEINDMKAQREHDLAIKQLEHEEKLRDFLRSNQISSANTSHATTFMLQNMYL
ncbi:hypothetical protein Hamer_G009563 [Homarus americanus]|uniref:Uncharacterized protein n=1 Tax=Homarus americanus TaxID=6706 RepID=A0A8J5T3I7_HOMAM|nr:hypothetical protein Hamer_G009563 [Homarus americanus]